MFPSFYLLAPNVFAVQQIFSALCFKTVSTHFIQPTRAAFQLRQVGQQFTHSTLEMLFFLYELADSSCLKRESSLDFITNIFSVLCVLNLTVIFKRLTGWKGKKSPVISAIFWHSFNQPRCHIWKFTHSITKKAGLVLTMTVSATLVLWHPDCIHIAVQFVPNLRLLKPFWRPQLWNALAVKPNSFFSAERETDIGALAEFSFVCDHKMTLI